MLGEDYPDIAETGTSFVENALIKAKAAASFYNMPVLADDSGICVPALNGAPGIYSARYAGQQTTAAKNIDQLLKDMAHLTATDRDAYFYGALVFLQHADDPCPIIITEEWHGNILCEQKENIHGFGYDPIFFIPELNCTAAELSQAEKNKISHRGLGLQKLTAVLKTLSTR